MQPTEVALYVSLAALLGLLLGFGGARLLDRFRLQSVRARVAEITRRAEDDANTIRKRAEVDAKDELFKKREEFNREMEEARNKQREHERRLEKKEDTLDQKEQVLLKKEKSLDNNQRKVAERKNELEKRHEELDALLAKQAQMLLERVEKQLSGQVASRIQRHEESLKATCEEKARAILATAIHRYAAEHTADTTVSTVDIPSDDMKGRIIGREGRNIRTFEKCTGVDVIVDDTPGVVIVSAFDNIRRETARLALTKLIQDGRIHPSRIEEVVKETQAEMEKHIAELGKTAVQEADIGKAADHEMEGGHPKIGAELAKRHGETNKDVLHAILGHHDDVTIDHIYTVLVASADAISAARPGARRETLEKYVKRLEELEAVASGFPGVEHAYAIQAGREVRVIANASQTSDSDAIKVCHDIARAIEEQLHYPGEIKVTVVRETRAVEYAR